jgi:hypothetical protein
MIQIRLECPNKECVRFNNPSEVISSEVRMENDVVRVNPSSVYICKQCGSILEMKVYYIKTEDGHKTGETLVHNLTRMDTTIDEG